MPRRKHIEIKLHGIAEKLGAQVYSESPGFICLLPKDVHSSVVGRGSSVGEAVENWNLKLQSHLRNASDDDPIVMYVKSFLTKQEVSKEREIEPLIPKGTGKRPTWTEENKPQHVIDFENQFYKSRNKR